MSIPGPSNPASPGDPPMPIGALLRAAADGELTPEAERALAAHLQAHPEDAAKVEFEQQLRGACRRAMSGIEPPPGLRDRVLAAAKAAERATPDRPVVAILDGSGGAPAGRRPAQRKGFGMAGKVLAYAAVGVLLVGGAVGYRMYYQSQIEAETLSIVGRATTPLQVASFVQDEHRACWSDETRRQVKFTVSDAAGVPDACRSWVGRTFSIDDCLASGLQFVGGGECMVPPQGARSAHFQFRTPEGEGEPVYVSLFVQVYRPDGTELKLEDGVVYTLKSASGEVPILAWRKGGLVHYLVSESPEQAKRLREGMKVAEPSQTL